MTNLLTASVLMMALVMLSGCAGSKLLENRLACTVDK
ncbi:MAG: hypothetical protein QG619_1427 [Pseudomonadota bacterium]|nr:hypothetical protein [Pseudomonadota bacterium]